MLNSEQKLAVLHDNNGTFVDNSYAAADFLRDSFSMDLHQTQDYLYIGYYKPFNVVYAELATANVNAGSFVAQIYVDGAWTAVTLEDDSKSFTRSGFLSWDKTDMEATEINSEELYWIRLRPSATHSATTVQAINIVFSDDNMLKQEFYEINDSNYYATGQTSHISAHVSARNDIMQKLNNVGYIKYQFGDTSQPRKKSLTAFDLHSVDEVRQASTYLALAKIFFNLSDGTGDAYWQKYREYLSNFEDAFSMALISIDTDDDGEVGSSENKAVKQSKRLIY